MLLCHVSHCKAHANHLAMASTKSWLRSKGWANKRMLSHLSLDGGAFSIPPKDQESFHRRIEDWYGKETMCFIEVKGDLYKFFVDIDYKSTDPLEASEQESLVRAVYKSIRAKLVDPEACGSCVVCTTSPKKLETGYKTGIHMLWPDLVVNNKTATLLSKQAVMDLEDEFGPRNCANSWEDVVDPSVYKHSNTGLRMKYNTKPGEPLRVYKPVELLTGEDATGEKIDASCVPIHRQLEMCTIRCSASVTTPIRTDLIEKALLENEEQEHVAREKGFSQLQDVGGDKADLITAYIKTNFPAHKVQQVRRVQKTDKDVYVIFVDSRYCLNLGREHKSNNVYFLAKKDGVYQKCFCTCNTVVGRKFGMCKDFRSAPSAITPQLKRALFSASKESRCPTERVGSGRKGKWDPWALHDSFLDEMLKQ